MRVITVKLEEDLLNKLDSYAENHNLYRSDVVRNAIIEYLMKHLENKENQELKVEKKGL